MDKQSTHLPPLEKSLAETTDTRRVSATRQRVLTTRKRGNNNHGDNERAGAKLARMAEVYGEGKCARLFAVLFLLNAVLFLGLRHY